MKQPLVERFTLAFTKNFAFLLSDEGKVRKFSARRSSPSFRWLYGCSKELSQ